MAGGWQRPPRCEEVDGGQPCGGFFVSLALFCCCFLGGGVSIRLTANAPTESVCVWRAFKTECTKRLMTVFFFFLEEGEFNT